jgi:hypothetical protein
MAKKMPLRTNDQEKSEIKSFIINEIWNKSINVAKLGS